MRSTVSVVKVRESIQESVREAMERADWKKYLEKGRPTSLKVNLGWELFIPGSITSPWVLEGVIQTIRDWVGPLTLVESDQVLENIEVAYRKSGMPHVCQRYQVRWINMSNEPTVAVEVRDGTVFKSLDLPRILVETQVITIPVMKTHAKTMITGALKNQWGCISKLRHNYHLVLPDALADINATVAPAFAVMDATIGLEGNGPKSGVPRIFDHILASADLVAMDTVQAHLMGLDPSSVKHLATCSAKGVGTNDLSTIEIMSDTHVERGVFQSEPARHNLVSKIEEALRRSRWKWVFFDTPVFAIMLLGAKVWYLIWYYVVSGKRHWKRVFEHPLYGPLWKRVAEGRPV